jgi:preprotein translocase subunit SecG
MEYITLIIHVCAAIALIVLVLLQHGKGADMGASFGSGSAGSVFGAAGSANFLSRATSIAAVVFFSTSLALTYFGAHRTGGSGVMQGVMKDAPASAPAKTDGLSIPGSTSTPTVNPAANVVPVSPATAPSAQAQKGTEIPK